MRILLVIVLCVFILSQTWARKTISVILLMVGRGGGAARGPNNPLNNRCGAQRLTKKADLVLAKEKAIQEREAAKEKERIEIQLEREEKKRFFHIFHSLSIPYYFLLILLGTLFSL